MWALPSFLSAGGGYLSWSSSVSSENQGTPFFGQLAMVMAVIAWIQGLNGMLGVFPQFLLVGKQGVLLGELVFPAALGYVDSNSLLQHLSLTPITKK